jgi:predicted secreted Zn-dependent protease
MISMPVLPVAGEPLVRVHTSYYHIDGVSATVLAAQLDQNGPVGPDGNHYAGRTRWDIQWRFRHRQQGTSCTVRDVAVAVGITQILPRWREEGKAAPALKARWSRFIDALKRHEDGHKEHGLKAGKEIEAAVLSVKPAGNCEEMEAAANAAAQAIVVKYQLLDEDYDRRTEHGLNQGATLL